MMLSRKCTIFSTPTLTTIWRCIAALPSAPAGRFWKLGRGRAGYRSPWVKPDTRSLGWNYRTRCARWRRLKIVDAAVSDRVQLIAGDMRRFKIKQYFGLVIAPLNTFLHNLTLDDQLATLSSIKQHLRPGGLLVLDCFNPDPAHAADDRRLILQRNVIDPETQESAQLWLTRSTDWGQQLQEITYFADQIDAQGQVTPHDLDDAVSLYFPA